MSKFYHLKCGVLPSRLAEEELIFLLKELRLCVVKGLEETRTKEKTNFLIGTIKAINEIVGNDFCKLVSVNKQNGAFTALMEIISKYLNGEVGWTSVLSAIKVEEVKLGIGRHDYDEPEVTATYQHVPVGKVERNTIYNSLAKLMAGIGPFNVGKIILLLDGELGHEIR